jgi:methionyl-tRNA synthetase
MSDKKFYLTTPIYYVNARPHIGHAYTTIVADVLARRHRLLGDDTFFLTGTDEHGQKIERSAAAAGIAPQQFADQVSKSFEDLWRRMGITNNDYIRTTSDKHKRGVQHLFSELYARGFIYLASYTGQYCVSDEAFVDVGPGDPCPDCGRITETLTEENFFFKLSGFQRPLLDLIESDTIAITPDSRKNEVLSFLRGTNVTGFTAIVQTDNASPVLAAPVALPKSILGTPYLPGALKDLSISRSSFTWGIPVPEPAASAAAQKHVIYVWLDALANYMTAIGYGSDDPAEQAKFKRYWPADLHLVGKEIIRFHCVYWPAFLLALNPEGAQTPSIQTPGAPGPASGTRVSTEAQGPQLTFDQHKAWAKKWLPQAITAHGWLLFEDSKMSKSRGNIVRTETILDAFGTLCPPPAGAPADGAVRVPQGFSLGSHSDERNGGALAPEGTSPTSTKHDRDLFASDVLRYFLLREIPFGQDGSFSFDALITRYNADLANGYGNLVSRTLSMLEKYNSSTVVIENRSDWDEKLWMDHAFSKSPGVIQVSSGNEPVDIKGLREYGMYQTIEHATSARELIGGKYGNVGFQAQLAEIALAIRMTDGFISSEAPWKLAKDSGARSWLEEVLYTAAESTRIITALLYPILPYATARVWAQLGLGDIEAAARNGELKNLQWGGLKPGTKLGPLGPLFPRADKGLAQIMTDMENPTPVDTSNTDPAAAPRTTTFPEPATTLPVGGSTALTTGAAPEEPLTTQPLTTSHQPLTTDFITIDDFAKIELRVAQILVAERIPKADKLLRLEVDLGPHGKRQILSGIAEWYTPEELTGRRIVVITNLAPRKMRGLESHGMLLAASEEGGKPYLATCGDEIALGARLK